MTTNQRVRDFITRTFYVSADQELGDDTSLIDSGIVDSTGMLEVILYVEDEFGITVADVDAVPENLESISRIVAFVERKLAALAAG